MPSKPKKQARPWIRERQPFQREESNHQFYNTRRWRNVSRIYREKNPLCEKCKAAGRVTASAFTDHIVRVKDGGDPYNDTNLQALCAPCHNSKSGKEAHGYKENI